ncbi:MAG: sigma-70 family RNA polymerase sigma factor [Opitutaceae bacterium]
MFRPARSEPANTARSATSREEALYDAGLVRRFHAGDETAFVEIMSRHETRMFSIAFSMLKNNADAEEIVQDTFLRAHRGLATFRGDASLATWLHRIALNLARNRYWYFFRRRRHATLSLDFPFSDENRGTLADLVASEDSGPARAAMTGEFSELVAECMAQLGAEPREILTMRNTLNRSYAQIARELGIKVGTVKSRIARARERLRALMTETCPEFGAEVEAATWFDPARPMGEVQVVHA